MLHSGGILHCLQKLNLPKRCVADECSSLFCQSNNKEEKGFITLATGAPVIKPYKTKVRCTTLVGSYIAHKN
jgi:hypothetical protein